MPACCTASPPRRQQQRGDGGYQEEARSGRATAAVVRAAADERWATDAVYRTSTNLPHQQTAAAAAPLALPASSRRLDVRVLSVRGLSTALFPEVLSAAVTASDETRGAAGEAEGLDTPLVKVVFECGGAEQTTAVAAPCATPTLPPDPPPPPPPPHSSSHGNTGGAGDNSDDGSDDDFADVNGGTCAFVVAAAVSPASARGCAGMSDACPPACMALMREVCVHHHRRRHHHPQVSPASRSSGPRPPHLCSSACPAPPQLRRRRRPTAPWTAGVVGR
jgi:hypothetical protein